MYVMGSENSVLDKCNLSDKYVEINNWRIYRGTYVQDPSSSEIIPISLFDKQFRDGTSKHETELCNNSARCLKIYRHPSIVKFHASGCRNMYDVFMITEQVEPLSSLFLKMSPLEICSGIHSITTALSFCHDKCKLRHNNLDIKSIFVTSNGTWKLAGMEFACLFESYTEDFQQRNRSYRNESIIPPEEQIEGKPLMDKFVKADCGHAGDVYAMGLLINKLLENIMKNGLLTGAKEFLDFIKKDVLIPDPTKRPKVAKLLEHALFQNDFLSISTFLKQITLKTDIEKKAFFSNLAANLRQLPEELVARRLVDLVLSRFVLVDPYANQYFLSHFLSPVKDDYNIISTMLYKEHVIPHILKIFEIRDRTIRKVLLTYFEFFFTLIEPIILKERILPEVLLSVKDTNNDLVVLSLRALAFLVPLLGSDIVIGGQRFQYFSESIPKLTNMVGVDETITNGGTSCDNFNIMPESFNVKQDLSTAVNIVHQDEFTDEIKTCQLETRKVPEIERSSPDGSESSRCQDTHLVAENDWLDWDVTNMNDDSDTCVISNDQSELVDHVQVPNSNNQSNAPTSDIKVKTKTLGEEFDIMALEIKSQSFNELDFFADMQPSISSNLIFNVKADENCLEKKTPQISFDVVCDGEETADGWDDC